MFLNIVKKNVNFNIRLIQNVNLFINYVLATYFLKILENKHDMIRSHETVGWAVAIGLHPSLRVVRLALILFHFYLLETKKPICYQF